MSSYVASDDVFYKSLYCELNIAILVICERIFVILDLVKIPTDTWCKQILNIRN